MVSCVTHCVCLRLTSRIRHSVNIDGSRNTLRACQAAAHRSLQREAAKLTAFGNSAALEQLALSFEVQLYGWRAWGEHAETHAVLVAKLNNDASSLASVHGLRNV